MNFKNVPKTAGVYLFKNQKREVIYVGKAVNLKNRLQSYFQKNLLSAKTEELVKNSTAFSIIRTEGEFEALLLESKLIKKHQPKYNAISKDDKHPLYIRISKEEFPKITTARKSDDQSAFYFGPFPNSKAVTDTLKFLRRIFPYCTEKRMGRKGCFYSHLGLCSPCPNEIVKTKNEIFKKLKKEYRSNVFRIKRILEGKYREVIKNLNSEMKKCAREWQFEKAGLIKSQLGKLSYLTAGRQKISSYLDNPNFFADLREEELKALSELLQIAKPQKIEGYDISNLGGKEATGSLVVFTGGEADKSLYRRFKIRFQDKADDLLMIREMVERRLNNSQWKYPDLILVDGGESQVRIIVQLLKDKKIKIPVVGLAKRWEEIIAPQKLNKTLVFKHILLSKSSPALKLLQRIRDEAHRFAKKYHLLLRQKNMLY